MRKSFFNLFFLALPIYTWIAWGIDLRRAAAPADCVLGSGAGVDQARWNPHLGQQESPHARAHAHVLYMDDIIPVLAVSFLVIMYCRRYP